MRKSVKIGHRFPLRQLVQLVVNRLLVKRQQLLYFVELFFFHIWRHENRVFEIVDVALQQVNNFIQGLVCYFLLEIGKELGNVAI